jgi:hypothetical protein
MDERQTTSVNFAGIQRLRDHARTLRNLILDASQPASAEAPARDIQPEHEERSATYIEIRPAGGTGAGPRSTRR